MGCFCRCRHLISSHLVCFGLVCFWCLTISCPLNGFPYLVIFCVVLTQLIRSFYYGSTTSANYSTRRRTAILYVDGGNKKTLCYTEGFIRNNRGIDQGKSLPDEFLGGVYDRIARSPISLKVRERPFEARCAEDVTTSVRCFREGKVSTRLSFLQRSQSRFEMAAPSPSRSTPLT